MPRNVEQSESGESADRKALVRALARACENTSRPAAVNKRIVDHLQATLALMASARVKRRSARANGASA